jgi:hypothetical protein
LNTLADIITYVRRIVKTPSNTVLTDSLIIDYINRFWLMDVDARIQLFDLKTKYQFQTAPGYDQYNMPLYEIQTEDGNQQITYYPVYQGFTGPAYVNGVAVPFYTEKSLFFNYWPNITQVMNVNIQGDGSTGPYNFQFPIAPNNTLPNPLNTPFNYILRGHVDITGIIALANSAYGNYSDPPIVNNAQATVANGSIASVPVANCFPAVYITSNAADGSSIVVSDSGQFLSGNQNLGLLMNPGTHPKNNAPLTGGYSTTQNVVNYFTGQILNLTFPVAIPSGVNISAQCYFFQSGLPRGILYNNNVLTLRSPPSQQWLVEIDAYLSPAAFLTSGQAIQFAYMSEYIARGAARKILSDTGDVEQFNFYEPLFKEQETLVWKRSQRQFTSTRTQTIYSSRGTSNFQGNGNNGYSF